MKQFTVCGSSYLRMDEDGALSMPHAALLVLPSELLEEILLSPSLSLPDLCRVRQVCWHLRHIVDRLWTKVASSRSERSRGVSHNVRILDGGGGAPYQAPPTRSGTVCVVRGLSVKSNCQLSFIISAVGATR